MHGKGIMIGMQKEAEYLSKVSKVELEVDGNELSSGTVKLLLTCSASNYS